MKSPAAPTVETLAPDFAARRIKALLVDERLCAEYGAPFPFFSTKDPLSELVSPCSRTAPKRRFTPSLPGVTGRLLQLGSRPRCAHCGCAACHPGLYVA